MKYLISISYDGSKFFGFQRLKSKPSVQKELEDALSKINKSKVIIKGAGRTDRGVHANDQKCHFKLDVNIPCSRLPEAINSLVSKYIYVKSAIIVDEKFHARFSVKRKRYIYKINLGEYNPQLNDYMLFEKKLNIKRMKKASKYLLGKHDFKNFVCGMRENFNSIIYKIKFKKGKDILTIIFEGKSFYRYMVRNLVGLLIMVGNNKIHDKELKEIFESDSVTIQTAKPNGLYLDKIWY